MKRWLYTLWASFILVLALVSAAGAHELEVHFIDVGQGGAVLLRTQEAAVLFDAGPDRRAADYLRQVGVTRLDLAIASHAHADHVGGFPAVLASIPVQHVWYNGQTHTTRTFERFIDAVLDSTAAYTEPRRGDTVTFGELRITVLHPEFSAADYAGPLHDHMVVLRAAFGDFSVLLTGDAEIPVEEHIMAAGLPIDSTVLQLGHHGSSTATGARFLAAVAPAVAVYQAEVDNSYGHPHREVVQRVHERTHTTLFGTAVHGTVIVISDGREFRVLSVADTRP